MLRRNAEDIAIFVLLVVALAGVVVAIRYGAEIITAVGQITAAIIGASATIAVAVLGHLLTQHREQKLEEHRALKKNYMDILERMNTVIRERSADDVFSNLFLQTCVVGSANVIASSKELLEAESDESRTTALENLIKAMRADVGLAEVDIAFPPMYLPEDKGTLVRKKKG